MNMWIAKLHKFSRKFVGWITAAGPIIAYVLSTLTIVVGVIIYATIIWPRAWWYWVAAGLIGLFFSILVERLTLTQAAKVRVANERREDIKTAYAKEENPTAETQANEERELNAVKDNGASVLMVVGAVISTAAGTLFWHYLLQGLPEWQAWGFSTLFSMLISFTLVSSELHRHLENDVISGSIAADHFVDQAGREDARDRVIDRFGEKHKAALEEALDHDTVGQITDYTAQQTLDDVLQGKGQIPMHVQREREARRIAAENERQQTAEQMKRIREARPKDEKEKPGLLSRAIGALKPAEPESSNGHRNF